MQLDAHFALLVNVGETAFDSEFSVEG